MGERSIHLNVPGGDALPRALLERGVAAALDGEGIAGGEISVTFLDDFAIAELHERYLGHDAPTDVLSFALHDEGAPPLGDVYVGLEQARRQAADAGVPVDEELVRLAVHGTLHVLGYDHPPGADGRATSEQYRRQEALVRRVMEEAGR